MSRITDVGDLVQCACLKTMRVLREQLEMTRIERNKSCEVLRTVEAERDELQERAMQRGLKIVSLTIENTELKEQENERRRRAAYDRDKGATRETPGQEQAQAAAEEGRDEDGPVDFRPNETDWAIRLRRLTAVELRLDNIDRRMHAAADTIAVARPVPPVEVFIEFAKAITVREILDYLEAQERGEG